MKVNILRANFTIQANCPMAELLQSPTHSSQMKKLRTFSEANEQTGGQGNSFSRSTARYLTFGMSKQSRGETSFLGRYQRIYRGSKVRKPKKKTKYDVNVFFEFTEFLGEVG